MIEIINSWKDYSRIGFCIEYQKSEITSYILIQFLFIEIWFWIGDSRC